jgi:hypothetical protein
MMSLYKHITQNIYERRKIQTLKNLILINTIQLLSPSRKKNQDPWKKNI